MAKITVTYEEHQGLDGTILVPMKMNISFPRDKMNWNKHAVYVPILAPFSRQFSEDYSEDIMSVTIMFEDLLVNLERPNHFGISLDSLVRRLEKMKRQDKMQFEISDIEQFIIQIDDLEELLRLDVRPFYEWRD